MTIEIKPAEIVGAEIGDRVIYSPTDNPGAERYPGTLVGLSTDYPGHLVIEMEYGLRHIPPGLVTLAPKRYAVGDEVAPADGDDLPNGVVLLRDNYLPSFKVKGRWFVIDSNTGVREIKETCAKRTIAWLPRNYTDNF